MNRDRPATPAIAQPLAPPPKPRRRPLRDWTERQRSSAVQALRYTHFVTAMKRILPIGAIALVASVVAYSVVPRHPDRFSVAAPRTGDLSNDLTMTKPRFMGTDEKGNPFTVTAEEGIQDPKNHHRAELKQVQADMQIDMTNWLSAAAKRGFVDLDAGTLKLSGGISLFTDSGYELHTPSADVDVKKNVFEGSHGVTGHGPLGRLSADRFHFDRLKRQVKLDGHVHMIMYPKELRSGRR